MLALYLATLAPGLYTLDSAELAAGAHVLGIVHATGYPVYLLLLKAWTLLVPVGEIAYRANLFSAVCAVGALVALRRALTALTGAPVAAMAAAALLGVSEPFWSQALRAEVYTLHALFLALILGLVVHVACAGTGRAGLLVSGCSWACRWAITWPPSSCFPASVCSCGRASAGIAPARATGC